MGVMFPKYVPCLPFANQESNSMLTIPKGSEQTRCHGKRMGERDLPRSWRESRREGSNEYRERDERGEGG